MAPRSDVVIESSRRYTLVAEPGNTWAAVEGIRLEDDVDDAVADVARFLEQTDTRIASWWLTERSTPNDLEERLLAAGLERKDDDYLIDGLLATAAPPPGPADVEARAVASVEEHVAARKVQYDAFGTAAEQRLSDEALAAEYGRTSAPLYAAWVDGRLVAAARAAFARCGALLIGGATLPDARRRGAYRALVRARWDEAAARGTPALTVGAGAMSAPILYGLGFEKVVQFRRLQSVASRS
jgi:GNAT acetyltransferase-like protein